jgi:hypothetical protein
VGQPEQFAKRTFAEDTERITRGAVTWEDPPEIGLVKVQGDGMLLVRRPEGLASLAAPWPEAAHHDEVLLELKMPGDHLGIPAVQRALLRRQARQVQRVEVQDPPWSGEMPLWLVAPHVPEWIGAARRLLRLAPGCYRVEPAWFSFVWIAANELPLREELVPFLLARSGRPLEEFARWVAPLRPLDWLLDMVQYTTMSTTVREEILRQFGPTDDPEVLARRRHIAEVLAPMERERWTDEGRSEGRTEGRLVEARAALCRVLARRGLQLSPEEQARIEACDDLAVLERWLDQAITASTAAEALQ